MRYCVGTMVGHTGLTVIPVVCESFPTYDIFFATTPMPGFHRLLPTFVQKYQQLNYPNLHEKYSNDGIYIIGH